MARRDEDHHYSYILTKDAQGEKTYIKLAAALLRRKSEDVQVLRGELLTKICTTEMQPISDGKPAHNFCLKRDPIVTLYGGKDDIDVTPLNKSETELLEAIRRPSGQFAVFSDDNKLDWGDKLRRGDMVYVKLPGSKFRESTVWSLACVQYVGKVEKLPGTIFGVIISDPQYYGRGSTNGFFRAYQYFNCEKGCGLFVSLDELSLEPNPPTIQTTKNQLRIRSSTFPPPLSEGDPPKLRNSMHARVNYLMQISRLDTIELKLAATVSYP